MGSRQCSGTSYVEILRHHSASPTLYANSFKPEWYGPQSRYNQLKAPTTATDNFYKCAECEKVFKTCLIHHTEALLYLTVAVLTQKALIREAKKSLTEDVMVVSERHVEQAFSYFLFILEIDIPGEQSFEKLVEEKKTGFCAALQVYNMLQTFRCQYDDQPVIKLNARDFKNVLVKYLTYHRENTKQVEIHVRIMDLLREYPRLTAYGEKSSASPTTQSPQESSRKRKASPEDGKPEKAEQEVEKRQLPKPDCPRCDGIASWRGIKKWTPEQAAQYKAELKHECRKFTHQLSYPPPWRM